MVQEVTAATFKKEVLQPPAVLVDLWAEWCMPCKRLAPIFEELSKEMKEVRFTKLNVEEFPELAQEYGVMNIPTMLVFKNGEEAGRIVGLMSKEEIKKKIQSFL
ncbi:MAG TPA: thioredoxin [Candidatus Nanoarchaeia archaeon]|nr:thioredoxin [Candidatus Nanoarchaeia archaeon]